MTSVALASSAARAQAAAAPPAAPPLTFQVADVHASPHSSTPFMRGGYLAGDRYFVRQGTMVDLIANAYGVDRDNVLGGPAWLDTDRFEIAATAPRTTSPEEVKLMLRALLADRFKLAIHNDTKPLPSYVLRVDKGEHKLKQADSAANSVCDEHHTPTNNPPGVPAYYSVTCHNQTMDQLRQMLQNYATAYLPKPVVDATGLQGGWDFELAWTWQPAPDGLTIFDAVDKQLGLKLALEKYPTPIVVVDSVNEKPTPNAPGLDKAQPPQPPAAFEVATLKPSPPDSKGLNLQVRGGQITVIDVTMQFLIAWAWGLNPNDKEALVGAPKWLDKDHYDITGKTAPDPNGPPAQGAPPVDFDDLQQMMRTLVTERFHLKSHMEDHSADAYTLVAATPKMKKGDPTMRTGCKEGPGDDGKDPRIANPILGRLLTCRNMTMAEFGEELRTLAGGYIFYPVVDATGLEGGYDFTLSFSGIGQLNGPAPKPASGGDASTAAEPSGAISLFDAINKQLGLKLEKQRRPEPALVIDHIDDKPTEN